MANPFDKVVFLKDTTPNTGNIRINSIINTDSSDISGSIDDNRTLQEVWNDIKSIALSDLKSDILSSLRKKANFLETIATQNVNMDSSFPVYAETGNYIGLQMQMPFDSHTGLRFKEILFASDSAGLTEVKIWDLFTGSELYEKTDVSVIKGLNKIDIAFEKLVDFGGLHIFVAIKNVGFAVAPICQSWSLNSVYAAPIIGFSPFMRINQTSWGGAQLEIDAEKVQANIQYDQERIFVRFSTVASIGSLIESYVDYLSDAYSYKCAILIKEFLMNSKRAGRSMVYRDDTRLEIEDLKKKYYSKLAQGCTTLYVNIKDTNIVKADPETQAGYFMGSLV